MKPISHIDEGHIGDQRMKLIAFNECWAEMRLGSDAPKVGGQPVHATYLSGSKC